MRAFGSAKHASWKEPITSIGEGLEKDRLEYLAGSQAIQIEELRGEIECLRDWSSGDVALSSLVRIVGDGTASTRQRIKAAAAVLGYKVHDDGVTEFVKRFLGSVCASTDIAVDYKIEAGELLRRHEAPRVASESVRPAYRAEVEGSEASRVEGWRRYLIDERKWKLVRETHNVPHWSQWAAHLYADDFVPPQSGWPPQPVVGPDAIRLHVERSELMRRAVALFAGCVLTADIADATTYEDIAGQWCGDVTDYVFAPNTLTVKFHDDRPANVFKITKYTYINDTLRIDWLNTDGKESVTVFAERQGDGAAGERRQTAPTFPSLLRRVHEPPRNRHRPAFARCCRLRQSTLLIPRQTKAAGSGDSIFYVSDCLNLLR